MRSLFEKGERRPKDEVRDIDFKGSHASSGGRRVVSAQPHETHGGDTSNRVCPSMILRPRMVRLPRGRLSPAAKRRERLAGKEAWLPVPTEVGIFIDHRATIFVK